MKEGFGKALRWSLLLPAFLPLVVVGGLIYPYTAPKTFLLHATTLVSLSLFSYLTLAGKAWYWERLKKTGTWLPGALLILAYATSYVGIDFYHSFWSTFERGDGLLTLTAIVSIFYLVVLTADRIFFEQFFKTVAVAGSLVGVIAVLSWLQTVLGISLPFIPAGSGRVGGTMGNAAFLAGYLGMTFFITLVAWPWFSFRMHSVILAGALVQLFAIFSTATRGTLIALLVALGAYLCYEAFFGVDTRRERRARGVLALGIVGILLFVGFRTQLEAFPVESIARLASISVTDATVSSRLFVWSNLLEEGVKSPVVGIGAEHVSTLFNAVYDPGRIGEQWFDRSHNAYLDYFLQYGILGLVIYLTLILALMIGAWRSFRAGELAGGWTLLLAIVYAVQNFFVFDTSVSLWVFVVLYGVFIVRMDESSIETSSVRNFPRWVSITASVAVLALLYPIVLQPYRANALLAEGYVYHISEPERAIALFEKGLSLNTYADLEYGYQAYEMYTERQRTFLQGNKRIEAYRYALRVLTQNYARYPYDARTAVYLAHVLDTAPQEEIVDEKYLEEVLVRAIELSPKRIQPWYLLANRAIKKGDALARGEEKNRWYRRGVEIIEKYAETVPQYAEPHFISATLYFAIGDTASAAKSAQKGLDLYRFGEDVARRAAGYYIAVEDWHHAEQFLQDIVRDDQDDFEVLYDLAKVKFLLGKQAESVAIVDELRKRNPAILNTDPNFLAAITAYESRQ